MTKFKNNLTTEKSSTQKKTKTISCFCAFQLILVLSALQLFSSAVSANCGDLYRNIWDYPTIAFKWATNHQTDKFWEVAYGTGYLYKGNAYLHFTGNATRLWSSKLGVITQPTDKTFGLSQPFDIRQPETVTIELSGFGNEITFSGKYGPYIVTACYDAKFMVVHTGISVETFSFKRGPKGPR